MCAPARRSPSDPKPPTQLPPSPHALRCASSSSATSRHSLRSVMAPTCAEMVWGATRRAAVGSRSTERLARRSSMAPQGMGRRGGAESGQHNTALHISQHARPAPTHRADHSALAAGDALGGGQRVCDDSGVALPPPSLHAQHVHVLQDGYINIATGGWEPGTLLCLAEGQRRQTPPAPRFNPCPPAPCRML